MDIFGSGLAILMGAFGSSVVVSGGGSGKPMGTYTPVNPIEPSVSNGRTSRPDTSVMTKIETVTY
ncbi:hypothetical protein SNF32_08120 [Enterococcus mundtii]|nr:hypothetical protein [Enterococcus mundtii]